MLRVKGGMKDDDRAFRDIVASVKKMAGSYVKVGLVGDKAALAEHEDEHGKPLTNVALMAIHEFGTQHLPERSVIRRVFDENQAAYVEKLTKLLGAVYDGRLELSKALDLMGFAMEWDMKKLIMSGQVTPPDSPATLARKAKKGAWNKGPSSKNAPVTLIDSGRLVAAITHAVVLAGAPEAGGTEVQKGSATLVEDEP